MRSKQPDSVVHCCIIFVLEGLPGLECFGPRSSCSPGFVLSCICLKLVLVQQCPLPLVSYGLSSFFVSDLFQKHMMRSYTVWSDLGTRSGQSNPTGPTSSAAANVAHVQTAASTWTVDNQDRHRSTGFRWYYVHLSCGLLLCSHSPVV